MATAQPPWLKAILESTSEAPRVYNWSPSPHPSSKPFDPRRIYILGMGNIGRLYASRLAAHSPNPPPITLVLHRRDQLDEWAANPYITIVSSDGKSEKRTTEGLDVEFWTTQPPKGEGEARELGNISNLILATKSTIALPEIDKLRRYLNAESTVAFAQNGMCKLWPPQGPSYVNARFSPTNAPSFAALITTHGVINLGPFRSKLASPADAKAGLVLPGSSGPGRAEEFLRTVASAPGLDSEYCDAAKLWTLQLEKLVVNSTINPITAILRVKNGALFRAERGILVDVMDRLLKEMSAVYQALVVHPSVAEILNNGSSSSKVDTKPYIERFAVAPLREMLWGVGYRVTENHSSMFQDVKAGKSTEIRDFNGWIVDMAKFLGGDLDVSANEKIIELVESGKVLSEEELGKAILG